MSGDDAASAISRPSWENYFMDIARVVATRATCSRKHVGAVIVRDKTLLSTGYNGSPRDLPHCTEVGCDLKQMGGRESCVRTVHAEMNAITQAARHGVCVDRGTIYTTASPCLDCAKAIVNAGIRSVVAGEFYGSRYGSSGEVPDLFKTAGVIFETLAKEAG